MIDSYDVPEPFIFNSLKHHLGRIRHFIKTPEISERSPDQLKSDLKNIGHSRIDLYTGKIPPREIARHFQKQLQENGYSSRQGYKEWIDGSDKSYQILTLSDGSRWTFRIGQKSNRHIHLHPARYSPYVSSVKALPLKTAIAFLIKNNATSNHDLDLAMVNQVRTEVLGVSPLKSLKHDAGLAKIVGQILL